MENNQYYINTFEKESAIKKKRLIYGAIGVLVLLFAGLVYAWSVLARPISEYFTAWSSTQLSFTFTLCIIFFCLGGLLNGLVSEKFPPKIMLKLSAILFLAGFVMASKSQNIMTLYIGYGVIAGLASGFAYNSVLGSIAKFFPDCPGLISGILLMGFGFGSFLIGKVYQAYTPSGVGVEAWRSSFMIFGVILFVVMFVSSFFIRKPTQEEIKLVSQNIKEETTNKKLQSIDVKPKDVLKKSSFWIYFLWATLLSASGLAVVSQASGIVVEVQKNISAGTISTVVGLISIFNGIGRVIFGGMFDKIGRLKTMLLNNILFVVSIAILMLAIMTSKFILIIIGFITIGMSYGGVTPTNAAFVNDFYGEKYYSVNLSLITMNLFIASFGSTIAGVLYDSTGSYFSTLIAMVIAVVIGFALTFMIKKDN